MNFLITKKFKAMTTQEAVMTTQEVVNRYAQLAKENKWDAIQEELYADDAVSIEPPGGPAEGLQNADGLDAIKKKGEMWNQMIEEMHGGYCSEPVVGGNHFSVAMGMDVTMKGGQRMQMDEIAVYEVKDGKIVKEQFFF
jgi:ketosteroid isomerase-like protein